MFFFFYYQVSRPVFGFHLVPNKMGTEPVAPSLPAASLCPQHTHLAVPTGLPAFPAVSPSSHLVRMPSRGQIPKLFSCWFMFSRGCQPGQVGAAWPCWWHLNIQRVPGLSHLTCGECISAPHWAGEDTEAWNGGLGCKSRWVDCRAGKGD